MMTIVTIISKKCSQYLEISRSLHLLSMSILLEINRNITK